MVGGNVLVFASKTPTSIEHELWYAEVYERSLLTEHITLTELEILPRIYLDVLRKLLP